MSKKLIRQYSNKFDISNCFLNFVDSKKEVDNN